MTGKTILLVDDHSFCRELFTLVLEREGYEVLTAEDGLEALEVVARRTPDLIILDAMMPRLDGFGFLEHYRASPLKQAPVVLLTALEERECVLRAAKLGVRDYILKSQFHLASTLEQIRHFAAGETGAVSEIIAQAMRDEPAVAEVWGEVG